MGMKQMNLFGISEEESAEKESRERQLEFYKKEMERLKQIKDTLINSKSGVRMEICHNSEFEFQFDDKGELILDDDYDRNCFLGDWWYANHIIGWNNNIPCKKPDFIVSYDGVPDSDSEAECVRSCFISVPRGEIYYDKTFALERLNKAIESYERELK